MIKALFPENEELRLKALKQLHLLDTPIEERFERITRMTARVLNVPMASFTLIDEDRQWFKSEQGIGRTQDSRAVAFCAHTILTNDVMVVENTANDLRFQDNPLVTAPGGLCFYAGCPVRSPDGYNIGSLCALDIKPRHIDGEQIQILRDLAAMVETELKLQSLAETQGRLLKELDLAQRLALIDDLTRVWNRAGIIRLLTREWSDGLRKQKPVTLIIADIDHFKIINDTYGHPVGDVVIKDISRRFLSALRTEDIVGRVGGEEFLIILHDHSLEKLEQFMERLRNAVIAAPIVTAGHVIPITLSYGVASTTPQIGIPHEGLIKRADDALYQSKQNGRNRVTIAV